VERLVRREDVDEWLRRRSRGQRGFGRSRGGVDSCEGSDRISSITSTRGSFGCTGERAEDVVNTAEYYWSPEFNF
jgi:hypothetical protein